MTRAAKASEADRAAAQRALQLMLYGSQFVQRAAAVGPVATPELAALLDQISDPPAVWLRCQGAGCGWRLAKLTLDRDRHAVLPVHAPTSAHTGRATPWLDRANAGKGSIRPGNTSDGAGTHSYPCPKCGHNATLRAATRMRRYLEAIIKGHTEIWA